METPTHAAPPVDLDRLVLHLHAGQMAAECPHCKGELSKKTPIMKGDENEEVRGRHGVIVAMRMATDPRPKCPHCYGRFELVIHLPNVSRQGRREGEA
jgi:transposase-like protein